MPDSLTSPLLFQILAVIGSGAAILGSLAAALVYRGKRGERYSPLNHFISELGEVGVSRLAWSFNLGLIVCGLCVLPACLILGARLGGVLGWLGLLTGAVTAVSISGVGVFPMNNIKAHTAVAMTYFRLGMFMVLFFSLAIAFQPPGAQAISPWFALAGLPAVAAYATFLLISRPAKHAPEESPLDPLDADRPRVWAMAAIEWSVFVTTVPWFLFIAAGIGG